VTLNREGTETAFFVDNAGFQELPSFLSEREAVKAVDLSAVANYLQGLHGAIQAIGPEGITGPEALDRAVRRLEKVNERIPGEHPQLKALLSHAAQSPDISALQERMDTLKNDFIQHYSTAVQMTVDTGAKAQAPAPSVSQPEAAPKPPPQAENVAAMEAKVKAGEVINLADLAQAIKADKQTAQDKQPAKTGTRGRGAAKPRQPTIKDQIASGKQQIAKEKTTAPSRTATKNKNAGLED